MKSRGLLSRLLYHSPLFGLVAAGYPYFFTPAQLGFLCDCVDETRDLPGCIVEVGCNRGATTIFLNRHLRDRGIKKEYYALDTFSGFTRRDISHEVEARGKSPELDSHFTVNDQRWFDRSMRLAGYSTSIRSNVTRSNSTTLHSARSRWRCATWICICHRNRR